MPTTYETGHAKNVANFESFISFINSYGASYNPSNPAILLSALNTKAQEARTASEQVNIHLANYNNVVAARQQAFEPLRKLSTRLFNALKATGASTQEIANSETNHRKLQGRRASAKLNEEEKQALIATGKEVNQISASQMSYDNQLDALDKQIKLLSTIKAYAPNEAELQITGLTTLYNDLLQKNKMVNNEAVTLSIGRIQRTKLCIIQKQV